MGRSSTFCWLTLTDHTQLGSSLSSWDTRHHRSRGSCRSFLDPWSCGASWSTCAIHGGDSGSHDGVPDDMTVQSLFDTATSAKNMMSRIRGYSPSRWALATQPRIPESLMIDDEDEGHVPHKDVPDCQDDEFSRSVRVRYAARRTFTAVDTDQMLRRAAVSASRPDRLAFEPGDLCYFWRDAVGCQSWHGHCGVSSWSRSLLR